MRRARCRVRWAAAAACLAASVLAPGAAEAQSAIVLTGRTTAWVDVTIPDSVGNLTFQDVTITTKGRFAGFYAEQRTKTWQPNSPHEGGGRLVLRDLRPTGDAPAHLMLAYPAVQPGVVRFYLIADGPTTVRIETAGRPFAKTLRPQRRTRAQAGVRRLHRVGDAWDGGLPVALGKRSYVLSGLLAEGPALAAAHGYTCVVPAGTTCPDRPERRLEGAGLGRTRLWLAQHLPGRLAPGRYIARQQVTNVQPVERALGAAFVLDLV